MFDVIVLSPANAHEVARMTGRYYDELLTMYYFSQDRKEHVVFTIEIKEWRIPHD